MLVVVSDKPTMPAVILLTLFSEITINSVFKSAVVENRALSFSITSLTVSLEFPLIVNLKLSNSSFTFEIAPLNASIF